jgi:predicted Zn-dependent protease
VTTSRPTFEERYRAGENAMTSPKFTLSLVALAALLMSACGLALDEQARYDRAKQAFDAGDFAAAQVDLKVLLQENPRNVDARLLLGDALMRAGDLTGAASELTSALELLRVEPNADPRLVEGTGKLGGLQLALRDYPAALESAKFVLERDPTNEAAYVVASQSAYSSGDNAAARDYAARLLERNPDHALAHGLMGFVATRDGAREEAEGHFGAALRLDPNQPAVRVALTQLQVGMGKHAEALATLAPLVVAQPTDQNLLALVDSMQLGSIGVRARVEELAQGIEVANAASPVPGLLRGRSLLQAREFQAAADEFRSSMDKGGGRYPLMSYYVASRAVNDAAPAQQALEQWVEANPGDQTVGFMLASAYLEKGENERARTLYENLVGTAEFDSPVILNNLAWLYGEINDPRAIEMARQAHQQAPDNALITDTLGWLLVKAGQREEGIQMLRLAVQQAPDSESIRDHLAAAMAEVSEQDEAERRIGRVLGEEATREPE